MITKAEIVKLEVDGECSYGVISNLAQGERAQDCVTVISPQLQRELSILRIFDVICLQPDHGPNNYNVSVGSNGRLSICAFDNDCNWTFFPWPRARYYSIGGCEPLLNNKGEITIPYIDKEFAENLMSFETRILLELNQYLNKLQIYCMIKRVKKIQHALKKIDQSRLLTRDCWNEETIKEELSGRYGNTYLVQYLNRKSKRQASSVIKLA